RLVASATRRPAAVRGGRARVRRDRGRARYAGRHGPVHVAPRAGEGPVRAGCRPAQRHRPRTRRRPMNRDLAAGRELADEIASSRREASLARSWLTITERQQPRPQRTVMRRLVPVAAGLVVVMMAAAGWFLVSGGGSHKALPADGQSVPIAQAWDAIIAA